MQTSIEEIIARVMSEDKILSDLNIELKVITAKIHARQNELVSQEKLKLNISEQTDFEVYLAEAQLGIP